MAAVKITNFKLEYRSQWCFIFKDDSTMRPYKKKNEDHFPLEKNSTFLLATEFCCY